ncbi:MAG: hypothetical protein OXL96_26070 [Candidatus Poribacteria bacterium]|nr:hypothetical protein [Candidatus Poribacteria bacterium]
MTSRLLFLFFTFSLTFLYGLCSIWAEAPKTAKIAFWADREGTRDIYLMNPDGSQQVKITHHRSQNITPVWSPTGEQILFVSDRDGAWDLYLMDPDGENVKRVFEKEAPRVEPAWSPDGKQIAYSRIIRDERVVHIATLGEKDEERIAIGGPATWSPDGAELAFITGWESKKMQITLFDLRTHNQKILFPAKATPSWMPTVKWSPTGDKLAFSWLNQVPFKDFIEKETIYTVNRDGTGVVQIIDNAGPRATSVAWSPRGDALLYKRYVGLKSFQIFKVNLDGGQPEQLTHIGWNHLGDWFDPAYALPVSPQPQLLTTLWGKLKRE